MHLKTSTLLCILNTSVPTPNARPGCSCGKVTIQVTLILRFSNIFVGTLFFLTASGKGPALQNAISAPPPASRQWGFSARNLVLTFSGNLDQTAQGQQLAQVPKPQTLQWPTRARHRSPCNAASPPAHVPVAGRLPRRLLVSSENGDLGDPAVP